MSRLNGCASSLSWTVAVVLSATFISSLAGCGSSGDSESEARADVENLLRHVLTEKDPALCSSATTPRYLNQNFGEHTDDPLEQCQFESVLPGEPDAREVDFKSVRVAADRAVATVSLRGGSGDGSVVRIELVDDGGRWKLDYNADIQIDRAHFDAASRRDLMAYGVTAPEASCAVKRVDRFFETDELERALVAGKTGAFVAAEVVCLSRRSLVAALQVALRKGAPKDVPDEILECVGRRITEGASTSLLRALFAAPDELTDFFERAARAAARACAKDAEAGLLPKPSPS